MTSLALAPNWCRPRDSSCRLSGLGAFDHGRCQPLQPGFPKRHAQSKTHQTLLLSNGPSSSKHPCSTHYPLKLLHPNSLTHTLSAIRLQDHILQHLLIHIFLQFSRHPPQHRNRDPVLLAFPREESESSLDLLADTLLAPALQFQRRDGKEMRVCCVAALFGIDGVDELAELGAGGGWGAKSRKGAADGERWYYAFFLIGVIVMGFGEERECFFDLEFFCCGDVVFFRELGLPEFLLLSWRRGWGWLSALRRLERLLSIKLKITVECRAHHGYVDGVKERRAALKSYRTQL